ncbi:tannase and feruloyl esterase [Xylariaceae sp. FL0594]|nr:tannase and feruloyl esterase [Xylariaceae sp. FL0594]
MKDLKQKMVTLNLITLFFFSFFFVTLSASLPASSPFHDWTAATACTTEHLTNLLPSGGGARIERVQHVTTGFFVERGNIGYPTSPQGLPDLCAVIVRNMTGDYRFGMFLPDEWGSSSGTRRRRRRLLVIGSYAFLGGINWLDMGVGVKYGGGSVALATDTGHSSGAGDITWANTTRRQVNWAYGALQGSVALGKVIVQRYYYYSSSSSRTDTDINKNNNEKHDPASSYYTYFTGCSTGGREGLKQIQLDASVFDGALIGAPAWDTQHLMPYLSRLATWNLPEDAAYSIDDASLLLRLQAEVLGQCDALDSVRDNVVSDPEACRMRFDISRVRCDVSADKTACWTPAQVQTAGRIYGDYVVNIGISSSGSTDTREGEKQKLVYTGAEYGSEIEWSTYLLPADPNYTTTTTSAQNVRRNFDAQYERYFMDYGSGWQITSYNDSVVLDAEARDRKVVHATADDFASLGAYRARGGKVIMYGGLADNVVPVRHTTLYYNRTVEALGGKDGNIDDFFRYFQIPGMTHCWGTSENVKAPWMMGGAGQAVQMPPYASGVSFRVSLFSLGYNDARHDALLALMEWVENGRPVSHIVASEFNLTGASQQGLVLYRQRPLCPYPQKAKWDGRGNQNTAASWSCG